MHAGGLSQAYRFASFQGPLGEDTLVFSSAHLSEEMNRLFVYNVDLLSRDTNIQMDEVVGMPASIRLDMGRPGKRYFHGIIARFFQTGASTTQSAYRAVLVPGLYLLSLTSNCRIFQDMTAPDILHQLLRDHGLPFESRLTQSYAPRPYTVQYNETDLTFFNRIAEEFGIFYYFEHTEHSHRIVLGDSFSAYGQSEPPFDRISYRPYDFGKLPGEFIRSWTAKRQLLPTAFSHKNYDFMAPRNNLLTEDQIPRDYAHSGKEIFEWPGPYWEREHGEEFARTRIVERQCRYESCLGSTDARGLRAGYLMHLEDHPRQDQNKRYLLLWTRQEITGGGYESGGGGQAYRCSFEALETSDSSRHFRPERRTARPQIPSIQTATVTGPPGETIYTDKYGRVKVQFHWDRYGKHDASSSCWMRVAQTQSGANWGSVYIPRVGQEVIVGFLDGNPDRPLILGAAPNALQMPTYELPAQKTKSVLFRSRTYQSENPDHYNELSVDDTPGAENLHIVAQKDHTLKVKNDRTSRVDNNQVASVGANHLLQVGNNHQEEVGNNKSVNVGGFGGSVLSMLGGLGPGMFAQTAGMLTQAAQMAGGAGLAQSAAFADLLATGQAHSLGNEASGLYTVLQEAPELPSKGGASLAQAGSSLSGLAGGVLRTTSGVLNTTVANTHAVTAGNNLVEQAGETKVSNVGQVSLEKVGKTQRIEVGEHRAVYVGQTKLVDVGDELIIRVGKSSLVMQKDGTILLRGTNVLVEGSNHLMHRSELIDMD